MVQAAVARLADLTAVLAARSSPDHSAERASRRRPQRCELRVVRVQRGAGEALAGWGPNPRERQNRYSPSYPR